MIGNDVVDIERASHESNWHRKGYLEKLFSIEEQHLITNATDPNRMVWLLWTMKESCYKIHYRQCQIRSFQPQNIICSCISINKNHAHGHVYYDGKHYFSKSIYNEEFIHTTSVVHPQLFSEIMVIIGDVCAASYDDFLAANHLSEYKVIKDKHHIPMLLNHENNERQELSISHHGRFTSLVYLPNHHC